ncbi:MAG TPA: HAMP domain-containing sensor histidine kinase [Pyrinomonadaceae bacterium]|jgi:signal transduction histidine kinase
MRMSIKSLLLDRSSDAGLVRGAEELTRKILSLKRDAGKFPISAGLLLFSILIVFGVYIYYAPIPKRELKEYLVFIGAASTVVLIGLSFLYYFAYRFYEDSFYLFLSIGWFANLIYIFFDTSIPDSFESFDYSLLVAGLSIFTSIPFYLAGFIYQWNTIYYRKLLYETIGWVIWFAVTVPLTLGQIYGAGPEWPVHLKFMVATLPLLPFSMHVLFRVGRRLWPRLGVTPHGVWRAIFPWTFFAWALLQLVYPFKHFKQPYPWTEPVFVSAFVIGLFLKVTNSIAALVVIYRDVFMEKMSRHYIQERFVEAKSEFDKAQVRLQERSALEDIGLLTASIEHDIRNPLVVIGSEIKRLKKMFQSDPNVLTKLEYIEEQRQQIFDATTIVPLLRGSNAFFQSYMQKVTLNDLINACIKDVKREMNPSNMYFRINKDHKSPKLFYITAYGPLLKQAIINILKNSIEAIREANRETGVIDIDLKEDSGLKGMIRVTVEDNGCGIAENDLPLVKRIFTTRDHRKPNSGLGLFISNRILEVHGGELEIASQKDVGTTVTLLIPKWVDAQHLT